MESWQVLQHGRSTPELSAAIWRSYNKATKIRDILIWSVFSRLHPKLMCWCVDVLMIVLMCWCVDVLMSWCVDVLMCWCVDDCVDVLMCWCVDVSMFWCVDVLMCWCVDVSIFWCVDVLMCWCVDVLMCDWTPFVHRMVQPLTVQIVSMDSLQRGRQMSHVGGTTGIAIKQLKLRKLLWFCFTWSSTIDSGPVSEIVLRVCAGVLRCWFDVLHAVLICWCVDVLLCWCVDGLMTVLVCWCVGLMCCGVDMLMCWRVMC